ncbi:MAG TPA: FtsX-like permease family protein [Vicinamibacterales bacterium]|jgi:lipoprotein-releasing system permease protein|nr:FtsX-like permease family protein [Vicinamibacterales bacterium]
MRFELFVALRYLLAPRRQARVSLVSLFSTIGVAVGVMALIIALALMTGLQGELRSKLLGAIAHVYVTKAAGIDDYEAEAAKLRKIPGVLGAAPSVVGLALVSTNRNDAFITIKGIDPALEVDVTDLRSAMRKGRLEDLAPRPQEDGTEDLPGILLGQDLAGKLGVSVGERVTLLTPQGTLSPLGVLPRARPVRVAGIYSLGLLEFDSAYGLVSLDFGERLMSRAEPDLIQVRVRDLWEAPVVAKNIEATLGSSYDARDWASMNQSLFSALWLEKMGISIAVALIVIVGALNIISSLILMVMQKSRDIAILKTMGASARSIMAIFIAQGTAIGIVGTVAGSVGGLALCWVLNRYKVVHIPIDVYQVSYVPFIVLPLDFAIVVVSAVAICFASTIYPSRQASRLDPVQALRIE